ncbi:MAG: hypothetical protein A2V86_00580 [Deltaproteobacteria bacterium RBG_16_49_23]|nr:MAG: hypothetical protein A2V86_00580 [Deltaproteobacteria bacterium RBG_16_49_23]
MKKTLVVVAILVNLFNVSSAQALCTGQVFNDVNINNVGEFFCDFIERFRGSGITGGCVADDPLTPQNEAQYCPGDNVTRSQMAVFVTRAIEKVTSKTPQQIALLKWYEVNQTTQFSVGNGPNRIAFDGANIWVTNRDSNNVTKLRANDGTNLGTLAVGLGPGVIAFDGANIWVANQLSNNVTKLRASDGIILGTFAVGTGPIGMAFDGANIWVTNSVSNSVSKL